MENSNARPDHWTDSDEKFCAQSREVFARYPSNVAKYIFLVKSKVPESIDGSVPQNAQERLLKQIAICMSSCWSDQIPATLERLPDFEDLEPDDAVTLICLITHPNTEEANSAVEGLAKKLKHWTENGLTPSNTITPMPTVVQDLPEAIWAYLDGDWCHKTHPEAEHFRQHHL